MGLEWEETLKRLLTILALVCWSEVGLAEWIKIFPETDIDWYFDPTTIRKTPSGVRAWWLKDHKDPNGVPYRSETWRSSQDLYEFNCAEEKLRMLAWNRHRGSMGRGDVVVFDDKPQEWSYAIPRSRGMRMLEISCKTM